MKVNNASLTGESEDINIDPDAAPIQNIFETKNVGFFGTSCPAGEGKGVCFRTGDSTVIGQIANLASSAESAETPLSIEIERFIKIISGVAIFLGVLFFVFGVIYEYDIITNLVFAIGIIVANVPEGLLATVTVSLALTAQRMAGKMVLVKNLESVEQDSIEYNKTYFKILSILLDKYIRLCNEIYMFNLFPIYCKNGLELIQLPINSVPINSNVSNDSGCNLFGSIEEKVFYNCNAVEFWSYADKIEQNPTTNATEQNKIKMVRHMHKLALSSFSQFKK